MCKVVADNGEFVAEAGWHRLQVKTNGFQHLSKTIPLIAATINVEDTGEASDA